MTKIRLRNTKTRKTEDFEPLDPANVRMYLCGPTVYDRAHIGNARNVIMFDVLLRLLRHVYGADHVTYVRNVTDVDDKINAKASETGRPIAEITAETTRWFLEDMGALGNLEPTHMPRATAYIPQMITMIEALIARGHAYAAEGHVLFDVRSYPDYGRLSGRSVDDMIAGARVEVAPYKRDPMDFVLWKPSSEDLPGWASPWGRGRPGWHIECSAMSFALLGPSFDIHGGGTDLQFPHHENEVAQSCCAHPEGEFARVWLHNEMLVVEGKKMSKSLGNFFTVRDLLDQGIPSEVIRYVFLMTHYSKPMDWTAEKVREAEKTLRKWRSLCEGAKADITPPDQITEALADDLNTSSALSRLHELARDGNAAALLAGASLLGLMSVDQGSWFVFGEASVSNDERIDEIQQIRSELRLNNKYAESDALREALRMIGVSSLDKKSVCVGLFEPRLLGQWLEHKARSAFSNGDQSEARRLVGLANEAGLRLGFSGDGPTYSSGFDEVAARAYFEKNIESVLSDARAMAQKAGLDS